MRAFILPIVAAAAAFGQGTTPMQCTVTGGVPPVVRQEGVTERMGDLLITCTGGTNHQPFLANLQLFLNTDLTSRLVTADLTEALLLIDEPGSTQNQRFCPSPSPGSNATGGPGSVQTVGSGGSGCTLTAVGPANPLPATGATTQTGTYNAFLSERTRLNGIVQTNSVTWANVPVVPPGNSGGHRTFRITNVRADATRLTSGGAGLPGAIFSFISISPPGYLPINTPEQVVGFIQPAFKAELRTAADAPYTPITLPGGGLNTGLLANNGTGATPQYLVKFKEGFQTAFAPRSTGIAGEPVPPQSEPGMVFHVESGFCAPNLSTAPEWTVVGLANSGTRLMASFSGIPPGVSLFVSAVPWPGGPSLRTNGARLTATDANGAGNYAPVATPITTQVNSATVPLAPVPVTSGNAMAVWEITDAPPNAAAVIESYAFAVFLAYPAGSVPAQTGLVEAVLAPLAPAGASIAPRFTSAARQTLMAIAPPEAAPSDLIATIETSNTDIGPNAWIVGRASVTNGGAGPALPPSILRVQLYSGSTPVGAAVDCPVMGGLLPGTTTGNCNWSLPAPATAGTYAVRATADATSAVGESNEANNTAAVNVHVAVCEWTLQRTATVLPPSGGGSVIPIQNGGCTTQVTYVGDPSWVNASVTQGWPALLNIQVQPNTGATRSTTVVVSGQTLTVWQAAAGCTYSMSPTALMLSSQGETKSIRVNTPAGCPWLPHVGVDAQWLTARGPANAPPLSAGPGVIEVTAAPNAFVQRSSMVSIAGSSGIVGSTAIVATQFRGGDTTPPFGFWDTPSTMSTGLTGAIPVSGWALDDTYVAKVQIWRDPVAGEPSQLIYIGDATFVNGARSDIANLYPAYPFNTRGGWGYNLLTNGLPAGGNGTFTLRAFAVDDAGNSTPLGSKIITCNNAHAVRPFGTVDSPAPGETVSGTHLVRGWALTPAPAKILENGSTIFVWVDGVRLGSLSEYSRFRSDIAPRFPMCLNSSGSGGRYYMDTTALSNGIHTIAWSARDTLDHVDGLGSRYFEVSNATVQPLAGESKTAFRASMPLREGLWMRTGYDPEAPLRRVEEPVIHLPQAERIEIHLPGDVERGCLVIGDTCSELPAGSTLRDGVFYWQAGAAFVGDFELRFGGSEDVTVRIRIVAVVEADNLPIN